jgi:hypothetical protein
MQVNQPLGRVLLRVIAPMLIAGVGLFWLWSSASHVAGQSEDEAWSAPINLSKSGSAAEPQIISDSLNTLHVIWQDTVDSSYVHVRTNEAGWSEPVAVEVPFGTRRFFPDMDPEDPTPLFKPKMASGPDGIIHAVWVDDLADLYHTSVQADGIETYENWSGRVKVASETLTSTLTVGAAGRIHVAYIQSDDLEEMPAGVYHRFSDDNGANWSAPVALQTSAYYRLLTVETANIQLAVDNNFVYVAWDDGQDSRVYLIRSADNGQTWEAINEIDRRESTDATDAQSPADIRIIAKNGLVHAVWQAGHDGLLCAQYHIWSQDAGLSWQPRERIFDRLLDCATNLQLLDATQTQFIMGVASEPFLAAWHRTRWSIPEDQLTLRSFADPVTLRTVDFSCGQDALIRGDDLWVASCGVDINQDIWVQQRSLASLAQPTVVSAWDTPISVAEGVLPVVEPVFIADEAGRRHAFWVQLANEVDAPFGPRTTELQYAQWEEGRWSRPAALLSSPEGKTDQPTMTVDGKGRIFVAWSGGNHGEIYFSQTSTSNASLPSDWSAPVLVTEAEKPATSPAIGVDAGGTIYIVYAVPQDEGRGIYVVTSIDDGVTWSGPTTVFDGVAAGWATVAQPRLTVNSVGSLHVLWLHRPLPSSVGGDSLYSTQSIDGGVSWSQAQSVKSSDQDGGPVLWHGIAGSGEARLVRVWQEWIFNRLNIWFQQSFDNGQNWTPPAQVSVLDYLVVPAGLTTDESGQFHLVYAVRSGPEDAKGGYIIDHWILLGDEWQEAESLIPNRRIVTGIHTVAAVANNSQLSVLFSSEVKDDPTDEIIVTERLYSANRGLELPDVTPTPPPLLTATPAPTASPVSTATPEPTPTLVFPTDARPQSGGLLPGQLNEMAGIIFGFGAVALLILGLFTVLAVNRIRSSRMRR